MVELVGMAELVELFENFESVDNFELAENFEVVEPAELVECKFVALDNLENFDYSFDMMNYMVEHKV